MTALRRPIPDECSGTDLADLLGLYASANLPRGGNLLVIILSAANDYHACFCAERAVKNGRSVLHIETDQLLTDWGIHISQGATAQAVISNPEGEETVLGLGGQPVSAVWIRRPEPPADPGNFSDEDFQFARFEALESAIEVAHIAQPHRWVNNPEKNHRARRRLVQLRCAASIGFRVPETIVTQSPILAEQFMGRYEAIAYKPLTNPFITMREDQQFAFGGPTKLFDDATKIDFEAVKYCPTQLQQYIPKKWEYRVTVVGNKAITVRIDSQNSSADGRVDYRTLENEMPVELVKSKHISDLCVEVTKRFGLLYSAIDLIEDHQGNIWFLDLNPDGQFLFIDKLLGEEICMNAVEELLWKG